MDGSVYTEELVNVWRPTVCTRSARLGVEVYYWFGVACRNSWKPDCTTLSWWHLTACCVALSSATASLNHFPTWRYKATPSTNDTELSCQPTGFGMARIISGQLYYRTLMGPPRSESQTMSRASRQRLGLGTMSPWGMGKSQSQRHQTYGAISPSACSLWTCRLLHDSTNSRRVVWHFPLFLLLVL